MSSASQAELPDLVVLGKIVRAQGLQGWLRVFPLGVGPAVAVQLVGKRVFVCSPDGVRTTILENQRWHRGVWIVCLGNSSTRDAAEALVGCELCLAEDDRPPLEPDQYYDDDLKGMRVVDTRTGEILGEVVAIKPSAAANLLQVRRPDGDEFLLPAVRAMITEVDVPARSMRVDLPDGLMDL